MPGPGNPQAWDRYVYVSNNPIKFIDPSGHCEGNANDPDNPDIDCWELYFAMRKNYKNVNVSFLFKLNELKRINKALTYARNSFGGQEGFERAFGSFAIEINEFGHGSYATPGTNVVCLGREMLNGNKWSAVWNVLHEVLHIFDTKDNNPSLYKSNYFVSHSRNPSANPGYLGALGDPSSISLSQRILYESLSSSVWYEFQPNEAGPTDYSKTGSIDYFAEVGAAFIMNENGFSFYLTQTQNMIFETLVNMVSK